MIQRKAQGDGPAQGAAHKMRSLYSEGVHEVGQPRRKIGTVSGAGGVLGLAVADHIGRDDAKVLRQRSDDGVSGNASRHGTV